MKNDKLSQVSDEQLLKSRKILTPLVSMLAVMLLLLFGMGFYKTFTNGFSPLLVTALALMVILIINLNALSGIRKEIKARNL